jgi:hypothetical protein
MAWKAMPRHNAAEFQPDVPLPGAVLYGKSLAGRQEARSNGGDRSIAMKYLIPPVIVLGVFGATALGTWMFAPKFFEECCEWIGLIAPDGVSEVPGQKHVTFEKSGDGQIPDSVPGLRDGDHPGEITLPDLHGEPVTIDFSKAPATVLLWTSSYCPTSKIYEERIAELTRRNPDVQWFGINSSAMEGVPELREYFAENPERLGMPVLKDERNVLADRFGARVTTESFVFDREGVLQYRGAIDDARNPTRVRQQFLRDAVRAVSAGNDPKWRYQPANGCCPIDRIDPEEEAAEETDEVPEEEAADTELETPPGQIQ